MSDRPTLIFIPGAWHQPTCYSKITKLLQELQFKCSLVTLPSTCGDPNATFKDDVDAARTAIVNEITEGHSVVVITHSYGGMVGNSAIKDFTRPQGNAARSYTTTSTSTTTQRTNQPQTSAAGYVVGLVLIASGFTLTGLAFMDPFFGIPPPSWRVNKETGFADIVMPPRELFYHDVPADEAEYWVSQLTSQSLKALFEGGEYSYAGWKDVPVCYIGTIEDRGLPVIMQRLNVGMARAMGCSVYHRELRTSHSPFLSQPDAVVEILVNAVGIFTGESSEREPAVGSQGNKIIMPAARIFQPFTWFRYGLPLVFGGMIGKGLVLFGWCRTLWRAVFS